MKKSKKGLNASKSPDIINNFKASEINFEALINEDNSFINNN